MHKNDNERDGIWARLKTSAKEYLGTERAPTQVARNVSTNDRVYTPPAGASLRTVNTLTPAQLNANQERHMKPHPEHSYGVSHNGAVREATTGTLHNRVGSQEKVARGYIAEDKASALKQEYSRNR